MDKRFLSVLAVSLSIALLASYGVPLFTQGSKLVSLAYAEEKISRICGVDVPSPTGILKFLAGAQSGDTELYSFNVEQISVSEDEVTLKKMALVLRLYNNRWINNATIYEKYHVGWLTVYVDALHYTFNKDHNRIYLSLTNATVTSKNLENNGFFYASLQGFKSELVCDKAGV